MVVCKLHPGVILNLFEEIFFKKVTKDTIVNGYKENVVYEGLLNTYNTEIPVVTDKEAPREKEILFGNTNRTESAEAVKSGEAKSAVSLDVNGSVRRSAAQAGLISIKPTYGTVSRYGTIPVACSGETVSVMAQNVSDCQKILDVIAGHDDKDGTSLPEEKCSLVKSASASVNKVANFLFMTYYLVFHMYFL